MERAVAPLLLQRRASRRRALSRLRAQLRHRDPSERHQHLHRPRHFRPRVHHCRTRDQGLGVKRTALTTLIRICLLVHRCRTRDGVQDQRATLTSLIRFHPRPHRCRMGDGVEDQRATLTSLIRLRLLARRSPTRDRTQEQCTVPTNLIRRYRSARR